MFSFLKRKSKDKMSVSSSGSGPDQCPVVETKQGKVRGRMCAKAKRPHAKPVFRYAAIPFAEPPLGELRFEPPRSPHQSWKGERDCTRMGKSPMQSRAMSEPFEHAMPFCNEFDEEWRDFGEDCLHLQVYTSKPQSSAKMPVFVWFYGGAFTMGSAACYDGSVLASLHDVVVVIPNYRVGPFGFLALDDAGATSGNFGMLDQVAALEWVRDNVTKFGGDPSNVTIGGESAGAISCSLHLVSPMSGRLFHKAISFSGTSAIDMMVKNDVTSAVDEMLQVLDITEKDPKKIKELLKKLPAQKLVDAQEPSLKTLNCMTPIKCDGKFLPRTPEEVLKDGGFHKVPYIIGLNNTETSGLSAPGLDMGFKDGLSEETARTILKGVFGAMVPDESKAELVLEEAVKVYSELFDKSDKMFWSRLAAQIFSDMWFGVATKKMTDIHSASGTPTFFYEMCTQLHYNHHKTHNSNPEALYKSDVCECDHGDDLLFTFGVPLTSAPLTFGVTFTSEEERFAEQWMEYLVNFFHTGDPNKGPNKSVPATWERYSRDEDNYLSAGHKKVEMRKKFNVAGIKFWTETLPSLLSA